MFCSLNLLKHTIMLNLIAVFLVCSGIGIAVHIALDLTHRPQSMKIMNAVLILSALWGPRNDKSEVNTVLSSTCAGCQCA